MPADDLSHSLNSSDNTRASNETERRAWLERQRSLAPETGRLTPGQVLAGRFTIVRFLARGGMGEVYEARDSFLKGDRVALKTIGLSDAATGLEDRFEKEVLLARQVIHPNVCPIYDLFFCEPEGGCLCFLTMKLLREESLAQRLGRMRVPPEEAQQITRQVAIGLRAAHEVGVIHRDLKPGNIMVEGAGAQVKAVITDFGLAREHEAELTLVSGAHIPGTPGYIAPELLGGQQATPASDLYAFGVLLHELFTGQRPIPLSSLDKKIPSIYARLIEACLDPDPRVRYQGFERALAVWEPRPGRRPAIYSIEPRWTRRRILRVCAAGGCAVAGALWWERDSIEDLLHPLPRKRFVALLPPPADADGRTRPMLAGALEAIEDDLSRAEASDHDLFVISRSDVSAAGAASNQLHAVRDALGANLVLQASALTGPAGFDLLLRVLDSSSGALLREKRVNDALGEIKSVANRAVEAAAHLLNVRLDSKFRNPARWETDNPKASESYESAEELMRRPNDAGLDAAVEKYKAALEADPRYAIAFAKLALAYCRLNAIKRDPAVLQLAKANAQTSLEIQPALVEGHQALAYVHAESGKQAGAIQEIGKAFSLDPSNPRTLAWEGQILGSLGEWGRAEQTYNRLLKVRPNYWQAYNDLGWVLTLQGKYQQAVESFRTATVAAPRSALAFNNLGTLYLRLGNFREASQNIKKSIDLKLGDIAYVNMATALRAEGMYNEALTYARKAVELNHTQDQNWLELGECYSFLADHKKQAIEAYEMAASNAEQRLRSDPADGSVCMLLALYGAKIRPRIDELNLVTKAESLGAKDVDSQLVKVRVLELLSKRREALKTLAVCFKRGTTTFEVELAPDLQGLRKDPAYQRLVLLSRAH